MKKISLAVILMAVAGGVLYYFLQNKKQTTSQNSFQKELITGRWVIDSIASPHDTANNSIALLLLAMDTTIQEKIYDFRENGQICISLSQDSLAKTDTSAFSWGRDNEFLFKENRADTVSEKMKVLKLDNKSFILQTSDSILIYMKKI